MTDLDRLIDAVEAGDEFAVIDTGRDINRSAHDKGELWPAHDAVKAFKGSLDAAKRLHDALLPGWDHRLGRDGDDHHALVFPRGQMDAMLDSWESSPHSEARIWLLATLKAYRSTQ